MEPAEPVNCTFAAARIVVEFAAVAETEAAAEESDSKRH